MSAQGHGTISRRIVTRRTIKEKYEITQMIKNSNKSHQQWALDFGVHLSTLRKWMQDCNQMEAWVDVKNESDKFVCKRLRAVEFKLFGEAAFAWYHQSMNNGLRITGRAVRNKVMLFNKKVGHNQFFMVTKGWLSHWKWRYGIKFFPQSMRKASKAVADTKKYQSTFKAAIEKSHLSEDQVFSCFETVLNYKVLPEMVEPNKDFTADYDGHEKFMYHDVMRIMVCGNASGTFKLPLLVIGRYKKPRGFEVTKLKELPVFYTHQTNAWISGKSFFEWYSAQFVPRVKEFLDQRKLPPKALLLIESIYLDTANMCDTQGGIEVTILHCGAKNELRTMNRRVLENLKRGYRFRLLTSILSAQDDESMTISDIVKIINIRDAIYWIADAWDDVPSWDMKNSWKKLWAWKNTLVKEEFSIDPMLSDADLTIFARKIDNMSELTESDVSRWILHDDDKRVCLTDDQILQIVAKNNFRHGNFDDSAFPWKKIRYDMEEKEQKEEEEEEQEEQEKEQKEEEEEEEKQDIVTTNPEEIRCGKKTVVALPWEEIRRESRHVSPSSVSNGICVTSSSRYNLRSDKKKKRLTRFSTTGASDISESVSPRIMENGLSTRRMSMIVDQSGIHESLAPAWNTRDELSMRITPIDASKINDSLALQRETENQRLMRISSIIGSEFNERSDSPGHTENGLQPRICPVNELEIHDSLDPPREMINAIPMRISSIDSSEFNDSFAFPQDTKSELLARISNIGPTGFHESRISLHNPKNEQLTIVSTISDSEFHQSLANVITYCEENNVDPEYLSVLQHLRDNFNR